MPLPFIFANASTVTTPQLDANYAALGALTAIPCTVAGTNALTLTGLVNTPTVSAYSNYQPFSAVAVATNTSTTIARFGALPALNVYKDSTSGPTTLVGGEIVVGNLITLIYDASLNSGAGGFHLQTGPASTAGTFLPLAGGSLTGGLTGTTASFSGQVGGANIRVGAGTPVTRQLSTTASLTWSVVAAGASQDQTVAALGASIGDIVTVGLPASVAAGIVLDGRVSATGVVSVRATNATSASLTPTGGTYRVGIQGFT
jgi:hypothetical protein